VRRFAYSARRGSELHAFGDKPLRFRLRPVVAGDGVAVLHQARHHLAAHHSKTDKPEIRHYSTQMVLMFVNSRMPCTPPNSRPCPDHFTPPNGIRGSDTTILFTKTIPDSISSAKRS